MLLNLKTFVNSVNYSWLNFKLQTQIILTTAVLVLVFISSLVSWSSTTVHNSPNINNNWFVNEITVFLSDDILTLVTSNNTDEIVSICERFYRSTTSIRYIVLIGKDGTEYGIPYNTEEILLFDKLSSPLRFQPLEIINQVGFDNTVTKIKVLANNNGSLLIGVNPSFLYLNDFLITNEIIFLFVIISIVVIILGVLFVKFTITHPLNEVSESLKSIAVGNFSKRINLRFGGELGDVVNNLNDLGRRLHLYDEKKREQLKIEKNKLESLVATITDGVLLLDTDLKIVLVNTTAIKLFGWRTKTRLIGTSIWDHLPIVLQNKLFVVLQGILFESQSAVFDGEIDSNVSLFPKRSIRIILNIVHDSQCANKIPIGIGLTIQDLTKEVELDKTQNRFMSNISHELRTPLFNIKSFIETIQEYDYSLTHWQKGYFLDVVNKETDRLTRLVNDILCISRLDSSNGMSLEVMNVVETLNQAMSNYQIVARDKNLYLHSEILIPFLNVQGSQNLLFQVLINLLGNALKFTYKDGEIILRAYQMGNNKVRVEITDTGIGIVDNYQQYIFQRFYRVENDVHTLKGTGLGLSIVDTILSEHKTEVNVVSKFNVGSVFWFDLLRA